MIEEREKQWILEKKMEEERNRKRLQWEKEVNSLQNKQAQRKT
jgi:hypothetical protein